MQIHVVKQLALNLFLVVVDGVPMRVIPKRDETPEQAVRSLFGEG